MKSAKSIRKLLKTGISAIASQKNKFCSNPGKDFSRNRKLNFKETINFTLSMTAHSLPGELRQYFKCSKNTPTKSAFVQQRHKIAPAAFRTLFDIFTESADAKKSFRGYRLLACDGTSVNLPRNPADTSTSVHAAPKAESYNILYLNALYDLMNKIYVDYLIEPGISFHEAAALEQMAKRLPNPEKTIIVADRGYGHLPVIYRLSALGSGFVLRCKDIHSNSFLAAMSLPDGEFDLDISKIITRSHKKEFRCDPAYMVVSGRNSLDFSNDACYPVSFRVCRFKLPSGGYECLVTNLPRTEFTASDLKHIYRLRWGIETSFRDLKYSIGLMYFHSKQLSSILQEVHAAVIMLNFCSLIVASIQLKQKSHWKYPHKINFAAAVGYCRSFFSSGETCALNLILREHSLVRPSRQYSRYLHDTKPAKPLTYRVS